MAKISDFVLLDGGLTDEHPAFLTVAALQAALVRQGIRLKSNGSAPERLASRLAVRTGLERHVLTLTPQRYMGIAMNLPARWIYPQAHYARMVVYCFDCWEYHWERWERFIRDNPFELMLFSARDSAEEMQRRFPGRNIGWMPEGIDPAPYDPSRPLAERGTDLLEFGRHSPEVNAAVIDHCRARGYVHKYRQGAAWLFPTQADLYAGLADAKLVVCMPKSMTEPECGSVTTMTLRYLETIASGALILGHCPPEMRDLFGYDPVIAIDLASPGAQLDAILGNLAAYEPLRQRNLARLHEIGTWDARAAQIAARLAQTLA